MKVMMIIAMIKNITSYKVTKQIVRFMSSVMKTKNGSKTKTKHEKILKDLRGACKSSPGSEKIQLATHPKL